MIEVLEHSKNVRWEYICPKCASLLIFGAEDVEECVLEKFSLPRRNMPDGIREVCNALICPVCSRKNMLLPEWKTKLKRIYVPEGQPETGSPFHWTATAYGLPNKTGYYLCIPDYGNCYQISDLPFSDVHKAFNVFDEYSQEEVLRFAISVSYWAERPEPPEELKV